jgi:carotenoid 1,2-hydratase
MTLSQSTLLGFDKDVVPGGYAWWYVDAVSDDGKYALTLIAFLGSVFSPYYAWARRRYGIGGADPLEHCAVNVAIYDLAQEKQQGNRWTMTERGSASVSRGPVRLQIGPSALAWEDGELVVDIDEISAPIPRRVQGRIRISPGFDVAANDLRVAIDRNRQHFWQPIAPTARVRVEFDAPAVRWTGDAYLDGNCGAEPLECAFREWQWSRAKLRDGSTAVVYDIILTDGSTVNIARRYLATGLVQQFAPSTGSMDPNSLRTTAWGIRRTIHGPAARVGVVTTLESGPFYARSLVQTEWLGESVIAVHESLSLTRFARLPVQAMLPFRMPRRK